jgi:hypothetical protein
MLSCCGQSNACPVVLEFGAGREPFFLGATQYRRERAFMLPVMLSYEAVNLSQS